MSKVRIYLTQSCPYCVAAQRLLQVKGIDYEAIDVSHDPEKRAWLVEVSGQRTVPQIFIDEQPIGGFTDLQALDREGRLDALLGRQA